MQQEELQLVGPLVACGAIPREAADVCLQEWQREARAGRPVSLLSLMVKHGLLTATQAGLLAGPPLSETQPFPDYRVLRPVGEGGMADVYEATYKPLDARVALKVLKAEFCLQDRYRLRFKREANILLHLDHPNIVEGREHGSRDGVDYYAMSFVDGVCLLDLLERGVELGEGLALHLACQIGSALEHMREVGIVHRDIKPANMVIDAEGTVRIIDFGLARVVEGMWEDTDEAMTVGTLEYMSPEQARGQDVDSRADVYSLGVSLFQMITGELPYSGTPEEILYAQVKKDLEFTAAQRARMSPPVQFVIRKTMAKDPDHRYATPQEMLDDLQAVAGDLIAARGPLPPQLLSAGVEEAPLPPKLVPGAGPRLTPRRRPSGAARRPGRPGRRGRRRR